jgi:hypothetical protein
VAVTLTISRLLDPSISVAKKKLPDDTTGNLDPCPTTTVRVVDELVISAARVL